MARPKKGRKIQINPQVTYFKPRAVPLSTLEQVNLNLDELEALRLKELEDLDQKECARKMGISQTTFQRILHKAHRKITDALINAKAIAIEKSNQFKKGGE